MEKRAILAVVLSMLVLVGYQYLFAPEPPAPPAITAEPTPASTETEKTAAKAEVAAQEPKKADALTATQSEVPGKDVVIETGTIRAVISTKGASIKSWSLKGYKDRVNGDSPVELVPPENSQLTLLFDENGRQSADSLAYISDKETLNGSGSVKFTAVRPDGIVITKTYTFTDGSYKARLAVSYENTSPSVLTEKTSFSLYLLSEEEKRHELYHELVYLSGKDIKRVYPNDYKDEKFGSGQIDWVFLGDKYFMTAVIPAQGAELEVYSRKLSNELYSADLSSKPLQIKTGETATTEYEIYFGPKDVGLLKAAGSRLERAIDLGFFDLVAYPLLLSFKWMYRMVPNYGVVIILLTVIIKAVFWPLSQKSYTSMKEMQKIAPLMEEIREKYKNDKERLNREVIELYRRHKVNPLGGCLPMILQMPVFFALYTVLNGAVELRHAPFALWLTDLSAKDPYYVTPVLMGATMFIQQKMTPSSGDPAQQKVMMIMPVIFTFMFLNFSSGLVLYWLLNNVLSIGQQYYVNKSTK